MTGQQPAPRGVSFLGSPAEYLLDQACIGVARAFGTKPYLVGSAMEKGDWRDVDVRVMLDDDDFDRLFPGPVARVNPLWSLLCVTISEHLSRVTGLPVDFQVQRVSDANARYPYARHPLTLVLRPQERDE